ncbi:MAG: helix-turn-helix domain-containing protein [Bacilli bacterium]
MISKIEKFDLLLGNKKVSNKTYLYSQIIKNERLKRKMTLQEMAHGICSISYLCKFEKNAISVDEDYIKAIFERVNLDYTKVGANIIENGVSEVVKACLYNHYDDINKYFSMIDDTLFNVQNFLIKGFYYLNNEKFDEFKEIIKTLDNIKDTLQMEDVGPFMYLVVEYYIKTNQFFEALKYLNYLDKLIFDFQEINWLIYEQQFITGYHTKNYPMAYKYYHKLINNLNIGFPNQRQLLIKLMMLDLNAKQYFKEVEKEIQNLNFENLENQFSLDVRYWKLIILLKGDYWFDVYDEIVNQKLFFDARFCALLLYTANLINDENYINDAMDLVSNCLFEQKDITHQKFINFMVMKFHNEKKDIILDYLKYDILINNSIYQHHLYHDVYDQFYLEYLVSSSKYKEAYYYSQGLRKA